MGGMRSPLAEESSWSETRLGADGCGILKVVVALVDIDDTLTPAQKHILEHVNSRAARHFTFEEMTWQFREETIPGYDEYVQEVLGSPELVREYLPYALALPALERLAGAGYEVHIASSRKENLHAVTEEWLTEHGFMPHVHRVHKRFARVEKGANFKVKVAREFGVTVAFDDTHSVVQALAQLGGVRVYVIDKPWNREPFADVKGEIVRVSSFAAAVDDLLT